MADDTAGEMAASDDPTATGPRRETYTSPTDVDAVDDDALADALAAEFARITASGPIAIVPAAGAMPSLDAGIDADEPPVTADDPPVTAVDEPAHDVQPEPSWEPACVGASCSGGTARVGTAAEEAPVWEPPAAEEAPVWEPPAVEEPPAWEPPVASVPTWEPPIQDEPTEQAPAGFAEVPAGEQPVEAEAAEAPVADELDDGPQAEPAQPAWMNLPAPDPAQAVDLPDGPPERPVRRSLPDDQLAGWADDAAKEGGTLSVIEELEAQLKLREEEARELHAWEQTVRDMGAPDADDPSEPAAEFEPASADEPEPAPEPEPEPEPEAEPEAEPKPEPVLDFGFALATEAPAAPAPAPAPEQDDAAAPSPFEPPPAPPQGADEELYRPPTGWFMPAPIDEAPPMRFSDGPDADAAADAAVTGPQPAETEAPAADDVPLAPVTGSFVLPEEPLAAWPAPSWDDPAPVTSDEAPDDDLTTGDVPADAGPAWNAPAEPEPDAVPAPEPEPEPQAEAYPEAEPEPQAEPEPDPAPEPDPEPFFLPQPEYEPLHPTSPVETISRGEPSEEPATPPDAPPPFAPPPLVEPPPPGFGAPARFEQGYVVPSEIEPIEAAKADDAADALVPNPAPEVVQQGGFPLGEHFYPSADVVAAPSSFDDALVGSPEIGEPVGVDRAGEAGLPAESLFIEPLPASANEPPVTTGSVTIIDQAYQEEIDDDVDETDRVLQMFGPVSVDTAGIAVVPPAIAPPSGPISTVRIREDEAVLSAAPPKQPVFSLEASGAEPTPAEYRVGRAARLFWLWFASNSSLLSIGLGAAVFGLGLSLSQSVGAILAGVALSFIPLGLSTLAGKRSGQPTMIVSRATFGLLGNTVPAVLALVSRLFWGAVLLWFLASSVAVVLVGAELNGSLSERQLLLIGLAGGLAIAVLIAFFGYALLARMQLVLTIVSGVLVVGLIGFTWQYVDFAQALTEPYGTWELTVTGTVLVFSFVGLVWAHSAGDLARYQHSDSSGPATLLWAPFGVTVPAFVLIAYGALLAASNDGIASGFMLSPLDTLALMLPSWYPIPLLAATILSLLSGVTVSLYSGGFALQAIGVRVPRPYSVPIVAVLLIALTLVITFAVPGGNLELFRDGATTLAVPVAAWAGIFAAEMMIRNRRFESQSLLQRGGVYPDVRWLNLIALVVITIVGWGLTTASITWLSWQGYAFGLLAVPMDSDLAGTDLGVLVALVLGLLVPIVAGIPGIRRQEATEV